jgi:two-component system chemotaxis response regulator CheB
VTARVTGFAPLPATARSPAASVRVMICDDSTVIRGALARLLDADPEITVVAKVENGKFAVDQVRAAQVDVVVLDIEMPVMDGLTALPLLLRADPGVRVIMASTLTTRGADIALRALRMGAADYVPKPSSIGTVNDDGFRRELLEKVKGLGRMRRRARCRPRLASTSPCAQPRCCPLACSRWEARPAGRRRCSPWSRVWDGRSAYPWS